MRGTRPEPGERIYFGQFARGHEVCATPLLFCRPDRSHEGPVVAFPRDVALDVVVADQKIALFQVPSSQRVQFFSPLHRIFLRCRQFPCLRTKSRNRFIENAVDKIEDARFPEFNKVQQSSTSCPHLIETEATENRALARGRETALGAGGRAFKSPRPDQITH